MKRIDNNKGFTIIELLIATVAFSVILMVITGAVVQIGRIYYKGVVQSRTQERARAITDSVAKNLQFSTKGSFFDVPNVCYSIGNQTYKYNLQTQVDDSNHGLLLTNGDCSSTEGTEMLGERMQLATFNIEEINTNPRTYKIHVRVVYGAKEDFLGDDPLQPCEPIVLGGQFCAVSELTTTVVSRLR